MGIFLTSYSKRNANFPIVARGSNVQAPVDVFFHKIAIGSVVVTDDVASMLLLPSEAAYTRCQNTYFHSKCMPAMNHDVEGADFLPTKASLFSANVS